MPQVRKILGSCTIEIAQRCRICKKPLDPKGTPCLVIKDAGGGAKNYCLQCARAILDQAADDLQALRRQLS